MTTKKRRQLAAAPVSIEEVCRACTDNDLDSLKAWQASGRLPSLMQENSSSWCPHELAAIYGHLKVIKWLVEDSEQTIDLTAHENRALRLSAQNHAAARMIPETGRLEVVCWMLTESMQLASLLTDSQQWRSFLPSELQVVVAQASVVDDFLQLQEVPTTDREKYLHSELCYKAVSSGIAKTVANLDQLLQTESRHSKLRQL